MKQRKSCKNINIKIIDIEQIVLFVIYAKYVNESLHVKILYKKPKTVLRLFSCYLFIIFFICLYRHRLRFAHCPITAVKIIILNISLSIHLYETCV